MKNEASERIPQAVIEPISLADFFAEPKHWELIEGYRQECAKPPFDKSTPNQEAYLALDKAGLIDMGVMTESGEPIGFVLIVTSMLPHFSMVCSTVESLYLKPEKRQGFAGVRLLNWAKRAAKARGSVGLNLTAVEGTRLERLCLKLGRKTSHNFFLEV